MSCAWTCSGRRRLVRDTVQPAVRGPGSRCRRREPAAAVLRPYWIRSSMPVAGEDRGTYTVPIRLRNDSGDALAEE